MLDAVLSDLLTEYQQVATAALEDQLGWVVRQLQQMHRLVNTVRSRAAHSPAINEWHTGFHATLEQAGVDPVGIDAEIKIGVFAVEGLLTHGLDMSSNRRSASGSPSSGPSHD